MLLSTAPADANVDVAHSFANNNPKLVLQLLSVSPIRFDHRAVTQPV
jgi:hypothetical protein